ncbi:hypothetical protein AB1Y20_015538 [Prymnesium parvum]|uniref:Uncharacterized protein n=1 Tax=Prymnesium parvum TaxID=97485 RepID=A0AB34K1U4_PRYPA|mmetsp:Transcript_42021/g.104553  ORF Transcript_42021/g.104553 Transcript_42021/m.104553 type:complete len:324 (-) Transcript_42021:548-1519(-)
MWLHLSALVAGQLCHEIKVGQAIKATIPLKAVCLLSESLPEGQIVKVAADVGAPDTRLCLLVRGLEDASFVGESCGEHGSATLDLPAHSSPFSYIIYPSTPWGTPSSLRLAAYKTVAAPPSPASIATPDSAAATPLLSPDIYEDCSKVEENQVAFLYAFCPGEECAGKSSAPLLLQCLEDNISAETELCRKAITRVEDCEAATPTPTAVMRIASILLLATASMVLLCTLLRCCCRHIGVVANHNDDSSTAHDEDLSDEEGSVGSVTPLPSGVKMMETPQSEPCNEEDELPAYTEVVPGASIARSTPSKEASSKDNYRPDVQLQ